MTSAQEFYLSFQTAKADLDSRFDTLSSGTAHDDAIVKRLIDDVQELHKKVNDEASNLPTYDRRSYETQLSELEARIYGLKSKASPKAKFAFKRKQAAPNNVQQAPADVPNTQHQPHKPSSGLGLASSSRQYLSLDSITSPSNDTPSPLAADLTISALDHCVVNLLDVPRRGQNPSRPIITAMHVRDVKDSLLVLGSVQGSVLMHDLRGCTVVVACHQLRIHTSHNCRFFVRVVSNAIIEDSTNLEFGPYPNVLIDTTQLETQGSSHADVQDFSHLKTTASPNWMAIPQLDLENDSEWGSALKAIKSFAGENFAWEDLLRVPVPDASDT